MPKPLKIKLSIPEPCSQDWDNMTPDEKGRHCSQCNKTVVDFSKFSDRELVDFFKNVKDKVCGRFNNLQLNRVVAVYEPSNTPFFKRVLFGTALAAGVASVTNGQNVAPPDSNHIINDGTPDMKTLVPKEPQIIMDTVTEPDCMVDGRQIPELTCTQGGCIAVAITVGDVGVSNLEDNIWMKTEFPSDLNNSNLQNVAPSFKRGIKP